MKEKSIRLVIFLLLGILVLLSARLAYADLTNGNGYCVLGSEAASCGSVQNSVYGSLFGIKVSYFGFVAFFGLLVIYFLSVSLKRYRMRASYVFFLASLIGALFSVYFLFVQIFVLKMMCSTCSVIDVFAICVFVFALIERKKRR